MLNQRRLSDWTAQVLKNMGSAMHSERRVLLICMGLSLMVWFFVKMSQRYESRSNLLLEYQLPVGWVFAEQPVTIIPFKYAGTGWKLLKMSLLHRNHSLRFQLSGTARQSLTRTDFSRKIERELELSLLEIGRDQVDFHLDSLMSKKLPIQLDTLISYDNGYYFRDNIVLSPDSVLVFGAPNLVAGLQSLKTEQLKMQCPEADYTKSLKIINPSPDIIQLSTTQTEVFMPVEQYTEKQLTVPIMVLNERDSVRLLPPNVELKCVVGLSRFNEIKPSDFRVVAVIDNESGSTKVPLTLVRLPIWVKSASFSPQSVEYLIVQ